MSSGFTRDGWLQTDFGRIRVSANVFGTKLIVETVVGGGRDSSYRKQILSGSQIEEFASIVARAVSRVKREGLPESV